MCVAQVQVQHHSAVHQRRFDIEAEALNQTDHAGIFRQRFSKNRERAATAAIVNRQSSIVNQLTLQNRTQSTAFAVGAYGNGELGIFMVRICQRAHRAHRFRLAVVTLPGGCRPAK